MKIGFKLPTLWAPKYTPGIAPDYHVWQKIVDYKVTGSPATSLTFNLLDPEVVLLMHMYDTKDRCNHVVTNNGATFDTTVGIPKFNQAAVAKFNGTSSYLSIADSNDWNFGSGSFTIEMWVRFTALPIAGGWMKFITQFNAGVETQKWSFGVFESSGTYILNFQQTDTSGNDANYAQATNLSLSAGVWYHFAVVKSGTTMYLFKDGVSLTLNFSDGTKTSPDCGAPIEVGCFNYVPSRFHYFNGWISELRIVKGLAKWTANFTPPNAPYYGGGDEDEEYRIVTRIVSGSGTPNFGIRFNGDAGTNYGYQMLLGENDTISAARNVFPYAQISDGSINAGELCWVNNMLYAKSGFVRTMLTEGCQKVSGTTVSRVDLWGWSWNNTADNIRSILVLADVASGLAVGTSIEIYRKKNAVPWWGGVGA